MRNKEFYDRVHEWDVKLEPLRSREEFKRAVKADQPHTFFRNYYVKVVLYKLVPFFFKGVTRSEIVDGICWVHDIQAGTKIKASILRQVNDEIRLAEQDIRDDGYIEIADYIKAIMDREGLRQKQRSGEK